MSCQSSDLELWDKAIEGLKSLDDKDEPLLIVPKRTMRRIKWRCRLDRIRTFFSKFRRKK